MKWSEFGVPNTRTLFCLSILNASKLHQKIIGDKIIWSITANLIHQRICCTFTYLLLVIVLQEKKAKKQEQTKTVNKDLKWMVIVHRKSEICISQETLISTYISCDGSLMLWGCFSFQIGKWSEWMGHILMDVGAKQKSIPEEKQKNPWD